MIAFWAFCIPMVRSLTSSSAFPPVSAARAYIVSCDRWKLLAKPIAPAPEYIPTPPIEPRVASPIGGIATSDDAMELRVTLGEVSQPISAAALYLREERPRGILRWDVETPAKKFGEDAVAISYSYRLEFDRSLMISAEIGAERQRQEFEELQRNRLKR